MSTSSYIRGLVSSDSHQETTVTDEEICRVLALYCGRENPLSGFELHLMAVLAGNARPITPKEQALAESVQRKFIEEDAINKDMLNDLDNEIYEARAYQRQEQELNSELLEECWGYAESASRSEDTGWYDEE